ncbi:DUF4294 domain-containing protein [Saccharicrinis aurantiacus]|uniref:DUF4294 domain-containing protein n=1 Tax=Saccharicrinis aurantiacus TaxID=1849719 RepID=UPI0009F9AE6B|nr:DUF4294 domain-containing protein [Saccharicrinis aurantiacus]
MHIYRFVLLLSFLVGSTLLFSQEVKEEPHFVNSKVVNGDTVPHINIVEVKVSPPKKFKSKRKYRRYTKLVRDIKKTLPYARRANEQIILIAQTVDTIVGEKEQKAYLKKAEKELFEEFEAPLRKLTFSQGRMLIKLIDRETGSNSYSLIKELKGGFSAMMWQSVARIFGSNLKSEFEEEGEDAMIEYIIYQIDLGLL